MNATWIADCLARVNELWRRYRRHVNVCYRRCIPNGGPLKNSTLSESTTSSTADIALFRYVLTAVMMIVFNKISHFALHKYFPYVLQDCSSPSIHVIEMSYERRPRFFLCFLLLYPSRSQLASHVSDLQIGPPPKFEIYA